MLNWEIQTILGIHLFTVYGPVFEYMQRKYLSVRWPYLITMDCFHCGSPLPNKHIHQFIPMQCYTWSHILLGPSRSQSYGSWLSNYQCNQCLSPLVLWVRTPLRRGVRDTTLCGKVCQWLETGRWFSPGPPVSSTNKIDRHDITEILLKVALNTINQTNKQAYLLTMDCFHCGPPSS
jgi:hypothetical protein